MENITYQIACMREPCCNQLTDDPFKRPHEGTDEPVALYAGESSRTAFTRSKTHLSKYNSKDSKDRESSALWRHTRDEHGGQVGPCKGVQDYKMWILGSWSCPMDRQIMEGQTISQLETSEELGTITLLNSKSDFVQSSKITLAFNQGEKLR